MTDQYGNNVDSEIWVVPLQEKVRMPRPWFDAVMSARLGFRVGIFASSLQKAQEILSEVEEHLNEHDAARIRRVNGDQSIDIQTGGGGRIRFLSTKGAQESTFDRVYLPAGSSEDVLLEVTPCLSTSLNAAIIGYF